MAWLRADRCEQAQWPCKPFDQGGVVAGSSLRNTPDTARSCDHHNTQASSRYHGEEPLSSHSTDFKAEGSTQSHKFLPCRDPGGRPRECVSGMPSEEGYDPLEASAPTHVARCLGHIYPRRYPMAIARVQRQVSFGWN